MASLWAFALSPASSRAESIAPPSREPPERSKPEGQRVPAGPSVRFARVEVSSGIPAEVVRRILRQNWGRYRLCYQQGLARNRKLKGVVATSFVIGLDGRASAMKDDGSTLPDAEVVRCIRAGTEQMSFPAPRGEWAGRDGEPVVARVHLLMLPGEGAGRERGSRPPAERPAKP